jgi:hypothetical protein
MIDPITGFSVNPCEPEAVAGPIRRSRYSGAVALALAFSTLVIGLPLVPCSCGDQPKLGWPPFLVGASISPIGGPSARE